MTRIRDLEPDRDRLIGTIVLIPRHVGDSFDRLPEATVIVNARAETDANDIHFADVVVALGETP